MSRLEHLLQLAQKTGDTLIIHTEQGRDMVIMDVSMYEVLHDMHTMHVDRYSSDCDDCECDHENIISEMNERDMLDKINRDIAVWRSYQDEDEQWDRALSFEDDVIKHPPFDPFEEDFVHNSSWHKAGDILQERTSEFDISFDAISDEYTDYEDSSIDFVGYNNEIDNEEYEPEYNELGEEGLGRSQKIDIPFVSHDNVLDTEEFSVEDNDEPIFFEEPV